MSSTAITRLVQPWPVRFGTGATVLTVLLVASCPFCYLLGYRYGVNKVVASNLFWVLFSVVSFALLALPWLNLRGLERFTTGQRMERMVLVWLFLAMVPHLTWELPWVLFYKAIMAGKGQMWAYGWWAYMDGGDMRYVTRDLTLVVEEIGASTLGVIELVIIWRRLATGKFSTAILMVLMAAMVAEFYPTYMYYTTEALQGFPSVTGTANLLIKFLLANADFLVMPWVVFIWAGLRLSKGTAAVRV